MLENLCPSDYTTINVVPWVTFSIRSESSYKTTFNLPFDCYSVIHKISLADWYLSSAVHVCTLAQLQNAGSSWLFKYHPLCGDTAPKDSIPTRASLGE